MNYRARKSVKAVIALVLLSSALTPAYCRGGGFGGFRGGGGFHGGDFGGFHGGEGFHGGGGFGGHSFSNFDHNFDHSSFGGGSFDHYSGGSFSHGGYDHVNGSGYGHDGWQSGAHANLGADGGFGGAAATHNTANEFSGTKFDAQGESIRNNSFEHNTTINNFGHNNISSGYHNYDSYGHNAYGGYGAYGYHGGAYGYHGGAYGYHPYGGYGYHNYGWGYHGYGAYGYHGIYGWPGGWYNPGFMEASMWTCMGLSSLTAFLGIAALSSSGGGGHNHATTNITYEGDNVYINGQPSTQYYSQAQQLAMSGNPQTIIVPGQSPGTVPSTTVIVNSPTTSATAPGTAGLGQSPVDAGSTTGGAFQPLVNPSAAAPSATPSVTEKWEPLGVYSLVEPGQKDSTTLFQLAVNKDGVIRGNYINQITNEKAQIQGAVDKKNGQMSWYVGSRPTTIFETNLAEITKQNSKCVVQFGANETQQMALIRMPQPKDVKATDGTPDANPPAAAPLGT